MTSDNSFLTIENNVLKRCDKNAFGEINVPDGVEVIEACAFQNCCHITKITLPNTVKRLAWNSVFRGCARLESIILSESIECLTSDCFSECVNLKSINIPNSINTICRDVFAGCSKLSSISLPEGLKTIDSGTFKNCVSLHSIVIPSSVTTIDYEAFMGCSSLNEITIPENVYSISNKAFSNCTSLSIVRILSKQISIAKSAFFGCKLINRIYLSEFNPMVVLASFADCPEVDYIIPAGEDISSELTTSARKLHEELANDLKYMSLYYRLFGMNITQVRWADNIKNDKSFKDAFDTDWKLYKSQEQSLGHLLGRNWNNCECIGLVLGFHQYRAIDVDGVQPYVLEAFYGKNGFDVFINQFLEILGLPSDYAWVVYSGSGKGFHIIFKADDIDDNIDFLAFEPNDDYNNGYVDWIFTRLELRWSDHLILPPSLHPSANRYRFRNNALPLDYPKTVSIGEIDDLIIHYCGELQMKSFKFKGTSFQLAMMMKIYSRHNSRLTPNEHTKDSLSWLKNSKNDESLNSLAIRYILGVGVQADAAVAKSLLLQSGAQSSIFNLVSLYACGYYKCNYHEFNDLLNRLDENVFAGQLETIKKNAAINIKKPDLYLFVDTETTGTPLSYDAPSSDTNNWPRLVQLSWILSTESGEIIATQDLIIRPSGFTIPNSSTLIHGISNQYALEHGASLSKAINLFLKDLSKASLILGHNIDFDKKVLGAELIRLGKPDTIKDCASFCTMKETVNYCKIPGKYGWDYKYPKLQELHVKLFGSRYDDAHDALSDVKATMKCFFELKRKNLIQLPNSQQGGHDFADDLPF